MTLETKPLKKIVESDLQELVDIGVREGKKIEYKREVGHREEDKKEFCRDVSSFANDSGGDLIIGIEEEQGVAKRLSEVKVANIDSEINRFVEIIS